MSGTTLRGLIRLNDTMLLGPDPLGSFISIAVKSIHRKRMPVKEVRGGQTASFALKKVGGQSHALLRVVPSVFLPLWTLTFLFLPRADQTLIHQEGHGDGFPEAVPTGDLGV